MTAPLDTSIPRKPSERAVLFQETSPSFTTGKVRLHILFQSRAGYKAYIAGFWHCYIGLPATPLLWRVFHSNREVYRSMEPCHGTQADPMPAAWTLDQWPGGGSIDIEISFDRENVGLSQCGIHGWYEPEDPQ